MPRFDGLSEFRPTDVRVDLGGRKIRVSQHRLDRSQVCTSFEKIRRKGVAKNMRRNPITWDPRLHGVLTDSNKEVLTSHLPSPTSQKHGVIMVGPIPQKRRSGLFEIDSQRVCRDLSHRHDPLFTALAYDAKQEPPEIDGRNRQSNELRYAQSGSIENLEHRDQLLALEGGQEAFIQRENRYGIRSR